MKKRQKDEEDDGCNIITQSLSKRQRKMMGSSSTLGSVMSLKTDGIIKSMNYPVMCDNCGTINPYYPISKEYPYQITKNSNTNHYQSTCGGHIQLKCIGLCFKFQHRYYTDMRRSQSRSRQSSRPESSSSGLKSKSSGSVHDDEDVNVQKLPTVELID